jgi:Protein of unknown function (DUF4449)
MAVTQHDSIFQSIKLPGGISTKATEFKELAAKGDRWESPVFGIGSAKESSDIPKLAAVSRKPHNAASGGVRGAGNLSGAGSTGYASTNGNPAGGFGNQVDQAFGMKETPAVNGTHAGGVHSAVTAQ